MENPLGKAIVAGLVGIVIWRAICDSGRRDVSEILNALAESGRKQAMERERQQRLADMTKGLGLIYLRRTPW